MNKGAAHLLQATHIPSSLGAVTVAGAGPGTMSRFRYRTDSSYRVCTDSVSQRLQESLRPNLHRPAPTRVGAAWLCLSEKHRPAAHPPAAAIHDPAIPPSRHPAIPPSRHPAARRTAHAPPVVAPPLPAQATRPSRRHPATHRPPNARPARPAARHPPPAAPPVLTALHRLSAPGAVTVAPGAVEPTPAPHRLAAPGLHRVAVTAPIVVVVRV
ncbi:hypothetical protein GGX14DRAFT_391561 [Mycena pura]|uniref:Uncharacterized protein n=1 Tax=Mycena pura TaxID=153505 RepID=A0AAD6YDU0_9AGAR|nr:hypothetical protein GGX14DRAFT_391561 [Mycena pura]